MNKTIETRLQRLELNQPNDFQLQVSKMTDAELAAQIKELSSILEKADCPNCSDCQTPHECKELHLQIKFTESQISLIHE